MFQRKGKRRECSADSPGLFCEAGTHLKSWKEHSNEDAVLRIEEPCKASPCMSWCSYGSEIFLVTRVYSRQGAGLAQGVKPNKWFPVVDLIPGCDSGSGASGTLSFVFWFFYLSESIYFKWNLASENHFLALSSRLLHLPLFSLSLSFLFFSKSSLPNGIYINMWKCEATLSMEINRVGMQSRPINVIASVIFTTPN